MLWHPGGGRNGAAAEAVARSRSGRSCQGVHSVPAAGFVCSLSRAGGRGVVREAHTASWLRSQPEPGSLPNSCSPLSPPCSGFCPNSLPHLPLLRSDISADQPPPFTQNIHF